MGKVHDRLFDEMLADPRFAARSGIAPSVIAELAALPPNVKDELNAIFEEGAHVSRKGRRAAERAAKRRAKLNPRDPLLNAVANWPVSEVLKAFPPNKPGTRS